MNADYNIICKFQVPSEILQITLCDRRTRKEINEPM